jgi:hypothetical protein
VREDMVDAIKKSILGSGWGNSYLTICDAPQDIDFSKFPYVNKDQRIYAIVDGAHRFVAIQELIKENPNNEKYKKFKFSCNYVGGLREKERFAYAFGNFN